MLQSDMAPVRIGEFILDRADDRLIGPHGPVHLGRKAIGVLAVLCGRAGRLVLKQDLFELVWDGRIVSDSALTSVIKELRRALGDQSRTPHYIQTVYGRGYRLLAPVTAADAAPEPAAARPLTYRSGAEDPADFAPALSRLARPDPMPPGARGAAIDVV